MWVVPVACGRICHTRSGVWSVSERKKLNAGNIITSNEGVRLTMQQVIESNSDYTFEDTPEW